MQVHNIVSAGSKVKKKSGEGSCWKRQVFENSMRPSQVENPMLLSQDQELENLGMPW